MVYGTDEDTIEQIVVNKLADQNLKLAILETHTGGELANRLTSVPGGYDILAQARCSGLERVSSVVGKGFGENPELSLKAAERLAAGIREQAQSDIGMAVIGDQDPDVGPYSKHTGQTYLGISMSTQTASKQIQLGGINKFARIRITSIALDMLRRYLLKLQDPPL
jgi:nicotinamide-nucleotide amidase